MKKQVLFVMLALLPIIASAYDAIEVNGIYYKLNDNALTAEVYRHPNYNYVGDIVIPESIYTGGKTYNVTSINNESFGYSRNMTSLTIPKSITRVSGLGFRECTGLTRIIVKSGNPKYDSRDNCNGIIETASNSLILGCKKTVIPNSVTNIGDYAFYGCSVLSSINIPESIVSIGRQAFFDCKNLKSIHIPSSVLNIREQAFWDLQYFIFYHC